MKIEQLQYLLDISQTKSTTITAQNFFISQQAVSDSMKRLEQEFNTKLLKRQKYGVTLTEAGQYFLVETKRILEIYDRMQLQLNADAKIKQLPAGHLNISLHPRLYQLGFDKFIDDFMLANPQISLSMIENDNSHISDYLQTAKVDVALFINSELFTTIQQDLEIEFTVQILKENKLYLCMTKGNPLERKKIIKASDIALGNITSLPLDCYIDDYFKTTAHPDANFLFCSNVEMQSKFIQKGLATGVLTYDETQKFFKGQANMVFREIIGASLYIALGYLPQRKQDPLIQYFVNNIHQYYTQ